LSEPKPQHTRLAEILEALEDMAAGKLDRRAPISPAHDEIDAIAYTVNVVVGELHYTVERLAQAERESRQANQEKSLFLRNISHELRTPLAVILSYIALLARTELDEQQKKAVDRIRKNSNALLDLIEELLDVARIEAGQLQLTLDAVSPAEVAADVVQSLLPQAKTKGLRLMLSMPPDLPEQIVTDARRLRQTLMNLVSNAVKFTDYGEVLVSLRTEHDVASLMVDVTDTGVGLSAADQQRLFSPFFQTDAGRGGAGLGLALARQISRQLGGELELVSSRLGTGSQFRLRLPIHSKNGQSSPAHPEKPCVDLAGLSVLFAEDDPDILASYAVQMELVGCKVVKVTNGLEAVNQALSRPFDVILLDVRMPILDGLEATRSLRQNGLKVPIIALSAYAMAEDRQRCLDAGCNEHIAKPIDLDQFLVRLAAYRRH
jgi:signal transduction histidine kinase